MFAEENFKMTNKGFAGLGMKKNEKSISPFSVFCEKEYEKEIQEYVKKITDEDFKYGVFQREFLCVPVTFDQEIFQLCCIYEHLTTNFDAVAENKNNPGEYLAVINKYARIVRSAINSVAFRVGKIVTPIDLNYSTENIPLEMITDTAINSEFFAEVCNKVRAEYNKPKEKKYRGCGFYW